MNDINPLHVAVGVIVNSAGEILISQRAEKVHQGGVWEFPGGKVELGETVLTALIRELDEELGIAVTKARPLIQVQHDYIDLKVLLDVWKVIGFEGIAKPCEGQPLKWLRTEHLIEYQFPEANLPIITAATLPDCYAILTGAGAHVDEQLNRLKNLLDQGIKLIQLRQKDWSEQALKRFLLDANCLCENYNAHLLVNSGVANALQIDGLSLHLTHQDLQGFSCRPAGAQWIGASCHNLTELLFAQSKGVDFAVLSPVKQTTSHPETLALGWEQFEQCVRRVNIPVYALGGMSKEDVNFAQRMGAQGVAGISLFND